MSDNHTSIDPEVKVKVLYYAHNAKPDGVMRIMQQLRKLYGNRIIALPKDILSLDKEGLSLNQLIAMRRALDSAINHLSGRPQPQPPRRPPQFNTPIPPPRGNTNEKSES